MPDILELSRRATSANRSRIVRAQKAEENGDGRGRGYWDHPGLPGVHGGSRPRDVSVVLASLEDVDRARKHEILVRRGGQTLMQKHAWKKQHVELATDPKADVNDPVVNFFRKKMRADIVQDEAKRKPKDRRFTQEDIDRLLPLPEEDKDEVGTIEKFEQALRGTPEEQASFSQRLMKDVTTGIFAPRIHANAERNGVPTSNSAAILGQLSQMSVTQQLAYVREYADTSQDRALSKEFVRVTRDPNLTVGDVGPAQKRILAKAIERAKRNHPDQFARLQNLGTRQEDERQRARFQQQEVFRGGLGRANEMFERFQRGTRAGVESGVEAEDVAQAIADAEQFARTDTQRAAVSRLARSFLTESREAPFRAEVARSRQALQTAKPAGEGGGGPSVVFSGEGAEQRFMQLHSPQNMLRLVDTHERARDAQTKREAAQELMALRRTGRTFGLDKDVPRNVLDRVDDTIRKAAQGGDLPEGAAPGEDPKVAELKKRSALARQALRGATIQKTAPILAEVDRAAELVARQVRDDPFEAESAKKITRAQRDVLQNPRVKKMVRDMAAASVEGSAEMSMQEREATVRKAMSEMEDTVIRRFASRIQETMGATPGSESAVESFRQRGVRRQAQTARGTAEEGVRRAAAGTTGEGARVRKEPTVPREEARKLDKDVQGLVKNWRNTFMQRTGREPTTTEEDEMGRAFREDLMRRRFG